MLNLTSFQIERLKILEDAKGPMALFALKFSRTDVIFLNSLLLIRPFNTNKGFMVEITAKGLEALNAQRATPPAMPVVATQADLIPPLQHARMQQLMTPTFQNKTGAPVLEEGSAQRFQLALESVSTANAGAQPIPQRVPQPTTPPTRPANAHPLAHLGVNIPTKRHLPGITPDASAPRPQNSFYQGEANTPRERVLEHSAMPPAFYKGDDTGLPVDNPGVSTGTRPGARAPVTVPAHLQQKLSRADLITMVHPEVAQEVRASYR